MTNNWQSDLLDREPNEPKYDPFNDPSGDQRVFLMGKVGHFESEARYWQGQAWWLKFEARSAEGIAAVLFVALAYMIWRAA